MSERQGTCIYTAISGGYDTLKLAVPQNVSCDWLIFTDDPVDVAGTPWRVMSLESIQQHPRMRAKFPKLCPHRIPALDEYKHTIWVDGSVWVRNTGFARVMTGYIGASGWAMYEHPARDCVYDELAAHLLEQPQKYAHLPVREQVACYEAEGMPAHWGLWQTTIIARDMDNEQVRAIGNEWWKECVCWTYADQLSFTPVLWRMGASVDTIPGHVLINPWYRWCQHRRDS